MHRSYRQQQSRQTAGGFTLVEVLLVVAIMVVVGGLGGGVYVGTYKRLLVEKAARQFLLMARYARIMAIAQQCPYELELDAANRGFLLATTRVNPTTGQTEKVPVRDLYCRPVQFEGEVKFEDVRIDVGAGTAAAADQAGQEQKITFLPSGATQSAIVQIGDGKSHYTIAIVAATGKASLFAGTSANAKTASIDLDLQQE
jgi:prepilin-type N-terminal cleavage/methylation domain-containing protein